MSAFNNTPSSHLSQCTVSAPVDCLLLSAMGRGDDSMKTGRMLVTFRPGGLSEALSTLEDQSFRIADARDFSGEKVAFEQLQDAEAILFPEIGVALFGGGVLEEHGFNIQAALDNRSPIAAVEPEYFAFAENSQYLRGFLAAATKIAEDLGEGVAAEEAQNKPNEASLDATWGLLRCKVPPSKYSGADIRLAVLDTGMDLGHPDFAGQSFTTHTFVGEQVHDLNGHGTHVSGTAFGPKISPSKVMRYGISHASSLFVGKVLTNSGNGTMGSVLAGVNWAIANGCHVINLSLGAPIPVQQAYTVAGSVALSRGLLIIAAAGNEAAFTGAPANSPTIMAVASLDPDLTPSRFSNHGKIDIAGPGQNIFSSFARPRLHSFLSGTSMAAPHVAGCAALWAQSDPALRGMSLWRQLQSSSMRLPHPASRVGSGLVQAP